MTKKFVCFKCGACCKRINGMLIIYPDDVVRISKYLCMSEDSFLKQYCKHMYIKLKYKKIDLYVLNLEKKCPFLDDNNLCSIHNVKPLQCYYGPDQYFLSIESQKNCIHFNDEYELNGISDTYFVELLLKGYKF